MGSGLRLPMQFPVPGSCMSMSAAPHSIPAPLKKPEIVPPSAPPVRPSSGRPWKWVAALAVAAIIAFVAYRAANSPAEKAGVVPVVTRTAKVTTGTLDRTVRLSGQTAAINYANISAPMLRGPDSNREMILMKVAKSGAWVKRGELIAAIDAQSLQDHVDDLGDTIEAANADVRKRRAEQSIEMENLQQSIRVAKSEMDKARLEYGAAEVKTDIERQLLKLSLDETEARYKQLQSDIEQKQASQRAEIRVLEITLERHTRHRDRHVRDIKLFSIYAPMDGLIVMSQIFRGGEMGTFQEGDRVAPGQGFMKVVDTKKMQIEGTINQAESSDVRVGQRAHIRLDAFPGLEFSGSVHSLGALATGGFRQGYYIRTVPVRIAIEGSDPRLIPDLSASADVLLQRSENGIVAPRGAITDENGEKVAYVKKADNTFERRSLSIGLQSDTQALILAGLQPGEEVRIN